MYTLYQAVGRSLPRTAYLKYIDVWLLFNLIKPFNDILVTTYIDYLKVDNEREVNHHGTVRTVGEDNSQETKENIIKVSPMSK